MTGWCETPGEFLDGGFMAKSKSSVFFCQECGHESAKWLGQCPACKQWNTFVEEKVNPDKKNQTAKRGMNTEKNIPLSLTHIVMGEDERCTTKMVELDRVWAVESFRAH